MGLMKHCIKGQFIYNGKRQAFGVHNVGNGHSGVAKLGSTFDCSCDVLLKPGYHWLISTIFLDPQGE
jgi:hypothetical protein